MAIAGVNQSIAETPVNPSTTGEFQQSHQGSFWDDAIAGMEGFLTGRDYHGERLREDDYARSLAARAYERQVSVADRSHNEAREDSQMQRMVADSRAAGVNPLHVIGGSSASYTSQSSTAPRSSVAATSAQGGISRAYQYLIDGAVQLGKAAIAGGTSVNTVDVRSYRKR